MKYTIAVARGDGVGPEVISQAIRILDRVSGVYGHKFEYRSVLAGGAAIDETEEALPKETIDICRGSDAVLLGAVGGGKWDALPREQRPETALLRLRKELGLFANIRPAVLFEALADACPLKAGIISGGVDIVVVRELTGGIYFGEKGVKESGDMGLAAYDVEIYAEEEVRRVARTAFSLARERAGKITSVDKANVLESSRLWRRTVSALAAGYPGVTLEHMYVDNAAMQLVRDPGQFDVILTGNMFGDILSDEAGVISGSIGMLPSASFAAGNFGLYEPVHGSAPDIAGKDRVNPVAAILSAAMMLRYSFGLSGEAEAVEQAVKSVLDEDYRTPDIYSEGKKAVGTKEIGALIAERIL
ncbi:MAG: 3-isopropylmalate dehydrogenase [Clostridiales Family XIII bacterium]|jgi:3-isopropylmalate dehydrogenase|nr:3-isopropylmalate dehydrogenase [Clostridiales Family XIII bacterium]